MNDCEIIIIIYLSQFYLFNSSTQTEWNRLQSWGLAKASEWSSDSRLLIYIHHLSRTLWKSPFYPDMTWNWTFPKVFRSHNVFRYAECQGEGSDFSQLMFWQQKWTDDGFIISVSKASPNAKDKVCNKSWLVQVCVRVRVNASVTEHDVWSGPLKLYSKT